VNGLLTLNLDRRIGVGPWFEEQDTGKNLVTLTPEKETSP
jgi:hypothetical protein